MARPISLTVHRNTQTRRAYHAVSKDMVQQARHMAQGCGIAGYAIIAWNASGNVSVALDASSPLNPIPARLLPSFVQGELIERINGRK